MINKRPLKNLSMKEKITANMNGIPIINIAPPIVMVTPIKAILPYDMIVIIMMKVYIGYSIIDNCAWKKEINIVYISTSTVSSLT